MYEGRLIFAQLMDYLLREVFDDCIKQYGGNFNNKGFICRGQFLAHCLLATIKKELKADRELHEIQEILSVSVFQKIPILQAFSKQQGNLLASTSSNQLVLF